MSHFCRATRKTPKNLDVVGVHSPCIQRAFDSVAHLPCIWLAFARIGVQSPTKKSISFLLSLLFFLIIGNGFQRFVGQTSITSIFFKYTVCGKKVKKKKKKIKPPPVIEIAPPRFQVLAMGLGPASTALATKCERRVFIFVYISLVGGVIPFISFY